MRECVPAVKYIYLLDKYFYTHSYMTSLVIQVVSLLLNYGADITLCNDKGQSVLDFAPDSMRPLLLGKQKISLFKMLNIKQHGGDPRH